MRDSVIDCRFEFIFGVLLSWLTILDTNRIGVHPSEVTEFGGGLIGGLAMILLGLAFSGLSRLYHHITKDKIEKEAEKTSFLEAMYAVDKEKLNKVFQAMQQEGAEVPKDLYKSYNPRVLVVRPKKRKNPWTVFLATEYAFKEGKLFKKTKDKNFMYVLREILDVEMDEEIKSAPEPISLLSLVNLMKEQKPEIFVDGE